jgi:hypothetical protein
MLNVMIIAVFVPVLSSENGGNSLAIWLQHLAELMDRVCPGCREHALDFSPGTSYKKGGQLFDLVCVRDKSGALVLR